MKLFNCMRRKSMIGFLWYAEPNRVFRICFTLGICLQIGPHSRITICLNKTWLYGMCECVQSNVYLNSGYIYKKRYQHNQNFVYGELKKPHVSGMSIMRSNADTMVLTLSPSVWYLIIIRPLHKKISYFVGLIVIFSRPCNIVGLIW